MIKTLSASQPIGIFDSGIGGLTVAQALVNELPHEDFIYFGDTAHMPYGDKSTAAIQSYTIKIVNMLLQQQCKLILIACHSASAAAYNLIREYIGEKAMVINVIDPVVRFLLTEKYSQKRIGLIGTRQTVSSLIYKKKIEEIKSEINLTMHATNLLAPAIEEFGDHHALDVLLETYLSEPKLQNIDALILACTHYPVIKERIIRYYKRPIDIIDSSEIVAQTVKSQFVQNNLLNLQTNLSKKTFYVSDYTDSFAEHARLFFKDPITLEYYPLWD